jgi:hypothetical protein
VLVILALIRNTSLIGTRRSKGRRQKMNTAMITDAELQLTFTGKRMNSRFEYNVIFQNTSLARQLTFKTIWANNKVEATRIAREYGIRFIDARVVEVQKVGN